MDVPVNPEQIAAKIGVVAEKSAIAMVHFDQASSALSECLQMFSEATQGAGDREAQLAFQAFSECDPSALKHLVARAVGEAEAYSRIVMGSSAPSPPASSPPPAPSKPPEEPPEVRAARTELPPPVVKGTRTPTHGRWSSADAPADMKPVTSGTRDDLYQVTQQYLEANGMGQTVIGSHVETKLAVHMRQEDIRDATVVINHRPCDGPLGCDTLLPRVLPEGSTLTVFGTAQDGTRTKHTYTGRQDT